MTQDQGESHTDFDNVDPAEHLARSAASYQVVKAMGDALARSAHNMEDYFHEDFRWRGNVGSGTKEGLAAFRRNWQRPFRAAFADRTYTSEQYLADGEWVACFGICEATHAGTFMGIPPTGKRVRIPYMDFWKVEDGRITDNPVSVDLASVCLQLGRDVFGGEGWEVYDRGEREPPPF